MTTRVHLAGSLPEFRVAVAALPHRVDSTGEPRNAVVVVDGAAEWWDVAADSVDGGARAVLVADPVRVPVEAIDILAARTDVPVLIHRPRLRHDLVAQAIAARDGETPRVVVAECRAEPSHLPALVRDAIGWLRVFGGGPMVVAARGGAALLRRSDGGHPAGSLIATASTAGGPVLRIRALGETTTELEIDAPIGRCGLSTGTARGVAISPALHESASRAALRRAIDVVADGASVKDLGELRHDAMAADALVST
ncbi:hypothetical protein BCL57_002170 [Agromyces flavus]|uniref:Uncharacterized protein n=1 Tax=Agromyces flavus TaxID=589382 RepID=A0A1H1P0Y1_9MICO|nr:hypothetical protein [Agromyces flavus]MCP2368011.1 hypothetical protein [Agromyces flavus]GGI47472.1 hypothetical protein GCM10010932_21600 [Agromyces flavus]SDS04685.1 hypothetical protein SAMN04489721_0690 [Agromyces flavus]